MLIQRVKEDKNYDDDNMMMMMMMMMMMTKGMWGVNPDSEIGQKW